MWLLPKKREKDETLTYWQSSKRRLLSDLKLMLVFLIGGMIFFALYGFPGSAAAESYTVLSGNVPGLQEAANSTSLGQLIQVFYQMAIAISAALAVGMLIYAGIGYATSDSFNTKINAKNTLQGVAIGGGLLLSAVILLNVINPNLTDLSFNPQPVDTDPADTDLAALTRVQFIMKEIEARELGPTTFAHSEVEKRVERAARFEGEVERDLGRGKVVLKDGRTVRRFFVAPYTDPRKIGEVFYLRGLTLAECQSKRNRFLTEVVPVEEAKLTFTNGKFKVAGCFADFPDAK